MSQFAVHTAKFDFSHLLYRFRDTFAISKIKNTKLRQTTPAARFLRTNSRIFAQAAYIWVHKAGKSSPLFCSAKTGALHAMGAMACNKFSKEVEFCRDL
jgi:hypothetical protein